MPNIIQFKKKTTKELDQTSLSYYQPKRIISHDEPITNNPLGLI